MARVSAIRLDCMQHAAVLNQPQTLTTVMANQMRMKLPSLKLTQRSTQGKVRHRTVPRGMTSSSARSPGCADDAEKSSQTSPESPGEAAAVLKNQMMESHQC